MSTSPIYVVIVAGGQGSRMGMALPKQFLPLAGKPILYHTVAAFVNAIPDANIILVLPESDISKLQMVLQHFEYRIDIEVRSGGSTRFESVQKGLMDLPEDSIILVHDGVRPFVDKSLILRCISETQEHGSAIPTINVVDSVRVMNAQGSSPINRDMLRIVQTPQTFKGSVLLPAFRQEYQSKFTDEATVIEGQGHKAHLILGEKNNIKITTPEDLALAEMLIKIINTPSLL